MPANIKTWTSPPRFLAVLAMGIILVAAGNGAQGQSQAWDSTYRPAIYPMMVGQFRAFSHSRRDIVFLGNSITFWGLWTKRLENLHVQNRGIPGDITFGVLDRLDEVTSGHPRKVFIMIGINDLARNIPDSVILANYRRIIARIREASPGTRIYFQSLLPTNPSFHTMAGYYRQKARIVAINTALKAITTQKHVGFIDLYRHFVDSSGNLIREYSWDGVHLNEAGYKVWVAVLEQGKYLKP
jgi:lysophospholipase L1-like esterase